MAGDDRMTLHLVRLAIDRHPLAVYAAERRLADDDGGYALHHALRNRFSSAAPQPFRYFAEHPRGPHLLGYVADRSALDDAAALPSADDLLRSVFPTPPDVQEMPATWRAGSRYDFEVRARPVVRFGKKKRAERAGRQDAWQRSASEIDAYVAACERVVAAGGDSKTVHREHVYRDWLLARLDGIAEIEAVDLRMALRQRTRRSRHATPDKPARTCPVEGPDALLAGTLRVTDPDRFAALLARGVGRHAAFGFGMLLLRPPGRNG
ncbi:hypothetical protein ASG37_03425 [Sphingomonas sp. Leaf407]|nr:hypothetical protein ASE97_03450 [Sphingomonas sp. Leaf42]KQT30188.1 hypothetical protein ASG37_03425 [Sphingomonas sp. Leaf407]